MIDTVGFIRKLPHYLIEAFKSTLEEAADADFLIHVIDASGEETDNKITVVKNVLKEIGAGGKPMINAYNKCDMLGEFIPPFDKDSAADVIISARTGMGIDNLIEAVAKTAPGGKIRYRMMIPYSDGGVLNELHIHEKVLDESYTDTGTMIEALLDEVAYARFKEYVISE